MLLLKGVKMQYKIACFEVRKLGEANWRRASEKMVLEKLAECFDPVSPIIVEMLQGNEIVARQEIYRIKC